MKNINSENNLIEVFRTADPKMSDEIFAILKDNNLNPILTMTNKQGYRGLYYDVYVINVYQPDVESAGTIIADFEAIQAENAEILAKSVSKQLKSSIWVPFIGIRSCLFYKTQF